jgi:hypothetical protein
MANESWPAYKGKVTIGANNVLGMGVWSWTGFNRELLDDTEFGDEYDDFLYGLTHCGKVTFNGKYKADDTQGQDALRAAMLAETELTDVRFFINSASYYTPNSTTAAGGGIPAGTPVGHLKVESIETSFDKNGLGTISFTAQVCKAPLRLV